MILVSYEVPWVSSFNWNFFLSYMNRIMIRFVGVLCYVLGFFVTFLIGSCTTRFIHFDSKQNILKILELIHLWSLPLCLMWLICISVLWFYLIFIWASMFRFILLHIQSLNRINLHNFRYSYFHVSESIRT